MAKCSNPTYCVTNSTKGMFAWNNRPSSLKNNNVGQQILASSLGSATSIIILNPLNVIKVSLQKSTGHVNLKAIVLNIFRDRGLNGIFYFWSGTRVGLMQALPSTVLYMTAYERFKLEIGPTTFSPGIAAAAARFISATVMSPLELVRTIQSAGSSESAIEIAKRVYSFEGIPGLYRGWSSSIMRDVPYSAIYWFTFEYLRSMRISSSGRNVDATFSSHGYQDDMDVNNEARGTRLAVSPHITNFVSGACAGVLSTLVTHPFDVLKTKHQLVPMGSLGKNSPKINLLRLYQQGGFSSLFRGLSLRIATVVPASGIMVTVYEAVKQYEF